jgi:hypothetical protein
MIKDQNVSRNRRREQDFAWTASRPQGLKEEFLTGQHFSAPRNPPSIRLSTSIVGDEATIAPDSALTLSPDARSMRTMGNAPGYKISLFMQPFMRAFNQYEAFHIS